MPFAFARTGEGQNRWTFGTTGHLDFESFRYYVMTIVLEVSGNRDLEDIGGGV